MRRSGIVGLALAGLLQIGPATAVSAPPAGPVAPLPVPTGDRPKLTCADFRKSVVDGSWSTTRTIQTPTITFTNGAIIDRGKTGAMDWVGMLEKDCAARRPS